MNKEMLSKWADDLEKYKDVQTVPYFAYNNGQMCAVGVFCHKTLSEFKTSDGYVESVQKHTGLSHSAVIKIIGDNRKLKFPEIAQKLRDGVYESIV